jgi:anti-sigma28 factor (negative regulator of flagellin synthesis)
MSKQPTQYKRTTINAKGEEKTVTWYSDTGRIEKEVDEDMKRIRSYSYRSNYDPIAVDKWKQENKIGEYREWVFDIERIKQIQDKVKAGEAHMHPEDHAKFKNRGKKYTGGAKRKPKGKTGGKLQRAAEEARLIAEIENM